MHALTRRDLLRAAGTLSAALMVAPTTALGQAQDALRVWRYKGQAASFLDLAGQAQTPYPITWVDTPGGNLVLEALRSGDLDYAYMSEIPPIFAALAGAPPVLIASFEGDANDTGLVVKRDSGIRQVQDLRGKSISYVRGTNTHYFVLNLLARNGLTTADITPVPLPIQDALTAFRNGHIDCVAAGGISGLQAVSQMDGVMLDNVSQYYSGNYVIATTAAALADPARRARIGDFLAREKATWAWVQAHPEAWAERSQALTGIDRALYLQQFEQRSRPLRLTAVNAAALDSQQAVADLFLANRLIRERVDVRALWREEFTSLLNS